MSLWKKLKTAPPRQAARRFLRAGREGLVRLSLRWYQITTAELQILEQQRLAAQIETLPAREGVISARYTAADRHSRYR